MRLIRLFNKCFFLLTILITVFLFLLPNRQWEMWRRFYPLPPVPARTPAYRVADKGMFKRSFTWHSDLRLREDGTIRYIREEEYFVDDVVLQHFQKQRGSGFPRKGFSAIGIASPDTGLFRQEDRYVRYIRENAMVWAREGKIHGYTEKWPLFQRGNMEAINLRGDVIGNAAFDTDTTFYCGGYQGHSRSFGILWRANSSKVEDINTLVAENTGWYMEKALSINNHGQILCLAYHPNENKNGNASHHLVVLTPFSPH